VDDKLAKVGSDSYGLSGTINTLLKVSATATNIKVQTNKQTNKQTN
jgi:hypothetical protein